VYPAPGLLIWLYLLTSIPVSDVQALEMYRKKTLELAEQAKHSLELTAEKEKR